MTILKHIGLFFVFVIASQVVADLAEISYSSPMPKSFTGWLWIFNYVCGFFLWMKSIRDDLAKFLQSIIDEFRGRE